MQNINTVIGVFDTDAAAKTVVHDLMQNGFDRNDIQVRASGESGEYVIDGNESKDEGGISGFFSSLFGTDDTSPATRHYGEVVRRGGTLVTVNVDNDDMMQRATTIFERHDAVDVDERASEWGMADDLAAGRDDRAPLAGRDSDDARTLEVIEENLHVGKRQVQGGKVRVYSRITEVPVEQDITLRHEHINVERRPVDRPVSADELRAFENQTIELTETSEEAVVAKQARVVEEVVISKDVEDRIETVRDTVRHTDVEVEKVNGMDDPKLR